MQAGQKSKILSRANADSHPGSDGVLSQLKDSEHERLSSGQGCSQGEELFAKAFRFSPDCVMIVKLADRTLLMANEATCRLWGRSQEDVIGKPTREFTTWLSEDERLSFMSRLNEQGECLNYETVLQLSSGKRVWFNLSSRLISQAGETCVLSVMSDITERKRSQVLLSMQKRVFEKVSLNMPLSEVLVEIASAVEYLLPETLCSILLLEADGIHLKVGAAKSLPADYNAAIDGVVIGPTVGSCGTAVFRREPVIVSDIAVDPLWRDYLPLANAHGLRACWSTPFFSSNSEYAKVLGTFAVYARTPRSPDDNFYQIIPHVAQLAAIAIERHRTEAALHESEQRLQVVTENLTEGLVIADPDGQTKHWNRAAIAMHGYASHDECLKKLPEFANIFELTLLDGERLEVNDWPLAQVIKGRKLRDYEVSVYRRDAGWRKIFRYSGSIVHDVNGKPLAFVTIDDVTEKKKSDEALRESEARYRGTLDSMMEGCQIVGHDWRYLYVNEVAAKQGRCEVKELLGRTMMECYPGIEKTPLFASLTRCMKGRFSEQTENAFVYPDGSMASFQLGIQTVPEGIFILSLDVSERKRVEAALSRSREEFKDLFDNAPVGYHEVDDQGRISKINQAELRMLGYTADELLGQCVWKIAADEEVSRQAVWSKLSGMAPAAAFERYFKRKNGTTFPVMIEDRLVRRPDGSVAAIRAIVQDITDRKQGEDRINRLNVELEKRVLERTAELETANKELEAFSYSVSHDLRAPLRAIDGFSYAVLENHGAALPSEGQRRLRTIRESTQRMGALIDDLLSFSRLSRQPLRKQPVDMGALVREVLIQLREQAGERSVEIKVRQLPSGQGDAALLKQVWVNLVSNAFKYTRKRENAVIEIGANEQSGERVYYVRDNGTGFDMRYAGKLFGVFQRLHRADEYEGTGVGLAIVQRVIFRHGGRIWAEAKINEGATFYFTLNGAANAL